MNFLLRKIRWNLRQQNESDDQPTENTPKNHRIMADDRVKRYFFYALGEILLVVIGILIALQIDNYSEKQKSIRFEKEILTQIKANLETDQKVLQNIRTKAGGRLYRFFYSK